MEQPKKSEASPGEVSVQLPQETEPLTTNPARATPSALPDKSVKVPKFEISLGGITPER
jgi:hypothetical protein